MPRKDGSSIEEILLPPKRGEEEGEQRRSQPVRLLRHRAHQERQGLERNLRFHGPGPDHPPLFAPRGHGAQGTPQQVAPKSPRTQDKEYSSLDSDHLLQFHVTSHIASIIMIVTCP